MDVLTKSIDSLIDELFTEESVEKSMIKEMPSANKTTADAAVSAAPKLENDDTRGAGRPKQISDVPEKDQDGARSGSYDGSIASPQGEAKKPEDKQVAPPELMKKSISDVEYEEFQSLKKAKAASEQAETLAKARREQTDLIKSAVIEATSSLKTENEELRKSLKETSDLVKSIANKPQRSKAVTNVQAVEKFEKSQNTSKFTKNEILDVAEGLVKSKQLSMESVIELENTGYIYDLEARGILERELKRRN